MGIIRDIGCNLKIYVSGGSEVEKNANGDPQIIGTGAAIVNLQGDILFTIHRHYKTGELKVVDKTEGKGDIIHVLPQLRAEQIINKETREHLVWCGHQGNAIRFVVPHAGIA